ncbi:hypothetical protein MRX96_046035 [Rhipicephalus microplus]
MPIASTCEAHQQPLKTGTVYLGSPHGPTLRVAPLGAAEYLYAERGVSEHEARHSTEHDVHARDRLTVYASPSLKTPTVSESPHNRVIFNVLACMPTL